MITIEKQLQNCVYDNLKCPCGNDQSFDICDNDCSSFKCRSCVKDYYYIDNDIFEGHHTDCGKLTFKRTNDSSFIKVFEDYANRVTNLVYDYIPENKGSEDLGKIYEKKKNQWTTKLFVNKDIEFKIPRNYIDIIVGIYSKEEGEFVLYSEKTYNKLEDYLENNKTEIFKGKLNKNEINFFECPIPLLCLPFENLIIKSTCDFELITSIVDCLFRKSLAVRKWKIRDNLYIMGGQIETDLDKSNIKCFGFSILKEQINQLPYLPTYNLVTKIKNLNNKNITCPSIRLTVEDKRRILIDLDLLSLYMKEFLKSDLK
jgi:hypothetical protein